VRRLVLLICVGLAGAAVAVVPSLGSAQAQGTTASFTAVDGGDFFMGHFWYATGTQSTTVSITPGGTVDFAYPTGNSSHNAVFTGAQPSACTQRTAPSGYSVGPAPPLPAQPQLAAWSGSCRFDAPGTYTFHCALHGEAMSGTVVVAAATTTTTTPTSTSTPTATTPTTTTFPYPRFPAAASMLRAASPQRGTAIRAQVLVTTPQSRLVADLDHGSPAVRLGRTTLFGVKNGTRHFTVHLYKKGVTLLRQRHRLTLRLSVQVLGQGLGPTTLSRHVTLTG
jgi:plastocyanin